MFFMRGLILICWQSYKAQLDLGQTVHEELSRQ